MNYMKRFAGLVCAVAAVVFFASCSKDKESGTIAFDSPAVFLNAGDAVTVGFSASNIESFSITGKPTGWSDPVIDAANRTITVISPEKFDDDNDAVKSGSVTLTGKVHGGSTASATLFVGVVDTEDLSGKPANSYLINKKETNYLIDAMYKGDVTELATSSVDVIWQSQSNLIQYLELKDGKASFYVAADSDDGDKIKEGNAVIGAYDAGGTLIWSWHVWAADYDPEAEGGAVDFNGYSMMTRNLGALAADNSSVENILASYGLYYQWGRKDPFIGPSSYNAANGASASMYNGGGSRVYLRTAASSAETGTVAYAVQHPLTFITGVSGSENDWLWSAHSDDLWSASKKSAYDPCPYGWRVAPSAVFDGLKLVGAPTAADADKYGWGLTDPERGTSSLFIGAGRRRYDNSTILNVYNPVTVRSVAEEAQPWEGLYWTAGTLSGTKSPAFHFWFEKKTTGGGLENNVPYARANGMSVRCVRVQ